MSAAVMNLPSTSSTTYTLPVSSQPANRNLKTPPPSAWAKPRPVVGGHRDPVNGVAWSSDGKKIVSCSQGDKGLRVWDVSSSGSALDPRHSQLLTSPYTYNSLINGVEFDPSNVSELASIGGKGADSRICWWDVRTPKPVSSVKPPFQPFQMSHHPTERVVAVSDIKEVITFYDQRMLPSTASADAKPLATTTGEAMEGVEEEEKKLGWAASETYAYPDTQTHAQKGAKVVVYDISFSATGSDLLVALGSGQVASRSFASLAKTASPEETSDSSRYQFNAHSGSINVLEVDQSGKYIATAGVDAIVNLWDTNGLIGLKSYGDMTGEGKQLSFSHNGEMLAAGGGDEPGVYVFSTVSESLLHKIPTGGSILSLAFSPKNDVLVYASNERTSSGGFSIVSMLPN